MTEGKFGRGRMCPLAPAQTRSHPVRGRDDPAGALAVRSHPRHPARRAERDVFHHARLERHAAAIDSRPDSVHLQPVSRLAWPPAAVVQRDVDRLDDRAARWQLHVRDSVRPRLFASGGGTAGRRQRSGASAGAGDGHRPFEPRRAPPARHLFPDRRAAGSRAALGTERGAAGTAARMAAQRPPCHHDAIRGERGHQAFGDDDRMAKGGWQRCGW